MLNIYRVKSHIDTIKLYSQTEGEAGVTRPTFSEEYVGACQYLIDWGKSLNLDCYLDRFGNLFLELPGRRKELPSVMVASHIDSVKNGGSFDGVLGVVCGLEILHSLIDKHQIPERSLVLAVFVEEEGVSFKCPMAGSKLFSGYLDESEEKNLHDRNGCSYVDCAGTFNALLGLPVRHVSTARFNAMFELHIEQGPVLEYEQINIGIVDAIAGSYNYHVSIVGESGHAGTVPLSLRKDAMVTAAQIILFVESLAFNYDCVATVGYLNCLPNATNVIPGNVTLTIDMRSDDSNHLENLHKILLERIEQIVSDRQLHSDVKVTGMSYPVSLSSKLKNLVAGCAKQDGFKFRSMTSGALHDAAILSQYCETSLIFVPSRKGISHNPLEWTDYKDISDALTTLYNTIWKITMSV